MTRRNFIWLPICFVLALVVLGIPFWQVPYNQDPFSRSAMLPGLIVLAVAPMLLVGAEAARARWVFAVMSMCIPVIDMAVIARDTAIDPTDHNLAPLELIYFWFEGAVFVVPGLIVGLVVRAMLRRRAA